SRESAESPQLFSPPELNRQIWDRATARLLAKMLGEFAYEKIIEPVPEPGTGGRHRLTLDDGGALAFTARRGVYGSWRVDPDSIEVTAGPPAAHANGSAIAASDGPQPNGPATGSRPFRDPLTFLTRARDLLGLDGTTLGHLIRELTRTLSADARLDHTALTAEQLAALDYA
ncbi:IucA/IucC family siderophore biosynthesis protein, partial [Streptomyces sp. SID7499]|nr:IucA/IucC family siderophore biosynthesis protein [Streptomyces sp. SID7499]